MTILNKGSYKATEPPKNSVPPGKRAAIPPGRYLQVSKDGKSYKPVGRIVEEAILSFSRKYSFEILDNDLMLSIPGLGRRFWIRVVDQSNQRISTAPVGLVEIYRNHISNTGMIEFVFIDEE